MKFGDLLKDLSTSNVEYLVAGAIGCVLSGYVRATHDLDLLVDLSEENLLKFIQTVEKRMYRPKLPVPAIDLIDSKKRKTWHDEKHTKVFTFYQPQDPLADVDLMIYPPIDFRQAWKRRQVFLIDNIPVYVASLDDLIKLKKDAIQNRNLSKDLYDLEALEQLKQRLEHDNN